MLIRTFKTNYFLQLILIFAIPALFWIPSFARPVFMPESTHFSPLYDLIYESLSIYPFLSVIIAFVLIISEGLLINYIFTSNGLIPKTTLLPAFIYILLMSCDRTILTLNYSIFVNLFLALSFKTIIESTYSKDAIGKIFISSFFVSIASLFYLPAIIFWLLIIIAFVLYKIYHWREWFVSFLGLLAPIIFISTYYFLIDELEAKTNILLGNIIKLPELVLSIQAFSIPYYIFLILFCIVAIFSVYRNMYEYTIFFRKKCYLILYYILLAFILFAYSGSSQLGLNFFSIPFSLILSMFLFGKQKANFYNTILLLFILLIFLNIYIPR